MEPKYPEIEVALTNGSGNAFSILAKCRIAMREANLSEEEIKAFTQEAIEGGYDNLLRVCMSWFEIV